MQWGKSKVEEALAPDSARVHPLSLESVWVITGGNQRARIRRNPSTMAAAIRHRHPTAR
jgi:hypothetical protein